MTAFYTNITIIITLAALLSYLNHRFVHLVPSIAIMAFTLMLSMLLLIGAEFNFPFNHIEFKQFVSNMHFQQLVINVLLGLLLFAGALTIDLSDLKKQKFEIALLSIVSTIASTFIIAASTYFIFPLFNVRIDFVYCMLFGSLISPTDPIAVLTIFKRLGASKQLTTIVSAESLFNDGVGVVLFLTSLFIIFSGHRPTVAHISVIFFREAIGGVIYGLVLGWIGYHLIRSTDDIRVETLLTIAIATGGYTLAQTLMISGALAMVVTGIFIANYRRHEPGAIQHRMELNHFWELIEELLNTILFLLLGLELFVIQLHDLWLYLATLTIFIVLLTRYLTVALPLSLMSPWRKHVPYTITILTWGGLRGGLAVALALSIPESAIRDMIVTLTYIIVAFSILVQGSTISYFVKKSQRQYF